MRYRVSLPGSGDVDVEVAVTGAVVTTELNGTVSRWKAVQAGNQLQLVPADSVGQQRTLAASAVHAGADRYVMHKAGEPLAPRVKVQVVRADGYQRAAHLAGGGSNVVASPMPGRVLKVNVKAGETVAAGAPVAVIEAMKMENELHAGRAGVVREVFVKAGDNVESGARILEIGGG